MIMNLVSIKGKSNYGTILKTETAIGMEGDRVGAVRMGMTCEKGECVETVQKDGKKTQYKLAIYEIVPTIKEYAEWKFHAGIAHNVAYYVADFFENYIRIEFSGWFTTLHRLVSSYASARSKT